VGWSGASKRGLLKSKDDSQVSVEQPSPKKKARFLLAEKGIREPGRESLGNVTESKAPDSDDDLEII